MLLQVQMGWNLFMLKCQMTTLINPATPAAVSKWPTLVLTEPIQEGLVLFSLSCIVPLRALELQWDLPGPSPYREPPHTAPGFGSIPDKLVSAARMTSCCEGPFGSCKAAAAAVLIDG